MRILVTGAGGFIGSHASEYFVNNGHFVTGIDNFDDFYPRAYKEHNLSRLRKCDNFILFEVDIRDKATIYDIFSEGKFDLIIHLAAKAGVRPSLDQIEDYYSVNVNGTLVLLEAMKKYNMKKLLFASSSSVYGNNPKQPFSEADHVDNPISPYASTKKSGELLCHVYSHLYGFDITCLRFFTVYGPRQRPDLAIHKFTRLIDEGNTIPVYGDGTTVRDYTYIEDIIDGIICASKKLNGYHIYNLGESRRVNLNSLIEAIESGMNKKANVIYLPMQPGDVTETYADISKARAEIGYNPKFKFGDGINLFINWYKKNKNLFQ